MNTHRRGVRNQWGEVDIDELEDTDQIDNWSANIPNRIKLLGVMVTPKVEIKDNHHRAIYTAHIEGNSYNFIVVGEREIVLLDDQRLEEILNHKKFYTPLWKDGKAEIIYFNFQWRRLEVAFSDNLGRPIYKFDQDGDKIEPVYFVTDFTGELRFVRVTDSTFQELMDSNIDGQGRLILEP